MALFRIQLVLVAVQLFLGVWVWLFPSRRITDPSKKLAAGCCYHSKRSAASQEAWDFAQKRYSRWCLLLVLPSAGLSFLTAQLLEALFPTESAAAAALEIGRAHV